MKTGGHLTTPFILLLCCIFAATVLVVLLLGADIYKDIANQSMDGYGERTCLAYIAAKVRHYDTDGAISVTDFCGMNVLKLTETLGGDVYATYIYLWEGRLYELFASESLELPPEAGNVIGTAKHLSFSDDDGLIEVVCDAGNGIVRLLLTTRSGKVMES